ncbi:DUF2079 domain-containing protein [Kitasatospora sp. NBC_00458]|uniref:DUF2079 domain-containing protein n=1 Tax=Kitasatospora sp. NBC_00458 TaxID=2903568 RepID=UPI002E195F53
MPVETGLNPSPRTIRPLLPRSARPAVPGSSTLPGLRTAVLTLLCLAVTAACGLQQWSAVQLGGFDLGIFHQGVAGYAHFGLPVSPVKSYHHEFPPAFSLLGDHFSPILAALAPLYWIWEDPRTLILGQALLLAAGVPLIRRIAVHCFRLPAAVPSPARASAPAAGAATAGGAPGSTGGADPDPGRTRAARLAADLAGLVYGLGWPLLAAGRGGFHEVAFAVPLTLLMFERGLARRYGTAVLAAALLCATKEDLGLLVGVYGLVLLWRGRPRGDRQGERAGDRRGLAYGAGLLVGGPLASALAIVWLIPAMGGQPDYYWVYGPIGPDAGSALGNVLGDPLLLLRVATNADLKPLLVLWLFGTLLLLPLRSATTLCLLPLLAERILSDNANHWSIAHHYDAFLWPVLLTATLEALGRLHARGGLHRRAGYGMGAAVVAVSLASSVMLGGISLLTPAGWRPSASSAALVRGAAQIPDGARVEADNQVVPRLVGRTDTVLVDGVPRGRDYVLIRSDTRTFPFQSDKEQAERIELLLAHGYRQVWAEQGVVLLHRESDEPVPGARVPDGDSTPVKEVVPSDVGHNLFKG